MTLIYHNIPQGTDEWLQLKAGRFSGTNAAALLVNGRSASGMGAELQSLIYAKAAEYVEGPDLDTYKSPAMIRGNELEPVARQRYEDEYFTQVSEVGFISLGDYFGVSPDGLVGEDGAIEIKCPGGAKYIRFVDTGEIPKAHYAQMQWLLYITGRMWCDYVVFHPDFTPLDLSVKQVVIDDEMHATFAEKSQTIEAEMSRVLSLVAKKEHA